MCVIWFIIHIESHGRVNISPDLVRQMWYMNMRVVVMVWARAGGRGGVELLFNYHIVREIFLYQV